MVFEMQGKYGIRSKRNALGFFLGITILICLIGGLYGKSILTYQYNNKHTFI